MFSITVYYKLTPTQSNTQSNASANFEVPQGFQWVGRGTEIDSGLCDWQIRGHSSSGIGAVIQQCEHFVRQNLIRQNYEVTVERTE
jgi:hypothetical protein